VLDVLTDGAPRRYLYNEHAQTLLDTLPWKILCAGGKENPSLEKGH
jgi:hypothetical protein